MCVGIMKGVGSLGNVHISGLKRLVTVRELRELCPQGEDSIRTTLEGREGFIKILRGGDKRVVVIVGPCSIHDVKAALEYAKFLLGMRERVKDKIYIMMRVYFEKPRTALGWKGLISDPHLNGSNDIMAGLQQARELLIRITGMGLPAATELLDPVIAAYIGELVSWVSIGARTTESQTHRQLASGLSAPIGYKNSTNGSLLPAVNAMKASQASQRFLGVDDEGRSCIITTKGNPYGHLILRGGNKKPNFHIEDIMQAEAVLEEYGFDKRIMVDCSHDNSYKDHKKQFLVMKDIIAQKKMGNQSVFGFMIESNLKEGNQPFHSDPKALEYGVSITDMCIDLEDTKELLETLYAHLD